ncbi:MAG: DUF503 family protein [Isosphaeraceae bacterium]
MTVATLRLDLRVDHSPSARDTRKLIQAISERLHKAFNVAVADSESPAGYDRAVLVVATVGRSRREARETLEHVADALAAHPRAVVLDQEFTEV